MTESREKIAEIIHENHPSFTDMQTCRELADLILALPSDGWRPEVRAFADLMEKMLASKDAAYGGNSWKKDLPEELSPEITHRAYELDGLCDEIRSSRGISDPFGITDGGATDEAIEIVTHIANYCMMIADVCGALPQPPAQSEGGADGWRDTVKTVAERANVNSYEMDEDDIASLLTGIRLDLNYLLHEHDEATQPPAQSETDNG